MRNLIYFHVFSTSLHLPRQDLLLHLLHFECRQYNHTASDLERLQGGVGWLTCFVQCRDVVYHWVPTQFFSSIAKKWTAKHIIDVLGDPDLQQDSACSSELKLSHSPGVLDGQKVCTSTIQTSSFIQCHGYSDATSFGGTRRCCHGSRSLLGLESMSFCVMRWCQWKCHRLRDRGWKFWGRAGTLPRIPLLQLSWVPAYQILEIPWEAQDVRKCEIEVFMSLEWFLKVWSLKGVVYGAWMLNHACDAWQGSETYQMNLHTPRWLGCISRGMAGQGQSWKTTDSCAAELEKIDR